MATASMTAPSTTALRYPVALALSAAGIFLLLVILSYRPEQVAAVGEVSDNLGGAPGTWIGHKLVEAWGLAALYPPLLMLGYALAMLRARNLDQLSYRLTGAVLLLPVLAGLLHLIPAGTWRDQLLMYWDQVGYHGLGGRVGWQLAVEGGTAEAARLAANGGIIEHPGGLLRRYLGGPGTAALLALLAVGCLWLMRLQLWSKATRVVRAVREHGSARHTAVAEVPAARDDGVLTPDPAAPAPAPVSPRTASVTSGSARKRSPDEADEPPARQQSSIDEVTRRIRDRDSTTSLDAKDLVERIRARRRALEGHTDDGAAEDVSAAAPTTEPPPAAAPETAVARSATPQPSARRSAKPASTPPAVRASISPRSSPSSSMPARAGPTPRVSRPSTRPRWPKRSAAGRPCSRRA